MASPGGEAATGTLSSVLTKLSMGVALAAWNEDDVIALFEADPNMAAVAYPLRASNRSHLLPQFQDLEYLTAGYMKIAQVRPL